MKGLLSWVKSNLIKERPEMFIKGDSVYGFPFPLLICADTMMFQLVMWHEGVPSAKYLVDLIPVLPCHFGVALR